jgi:hypothetical protein
MTLPKSEQRYATLLYDPLAQGNRFGFLLSSGALCRHVQGLSGE